MTSFCDEEEDDDKGAAGLLGEIENALGMGIGALGTNRWIKFNSLNSKDKNIETNRMCRIFRRAFYLMMSVNVRGSFLAPSVQSL